MVVKLVEEREEGSILFASAKVEWMRCRKRERGRSIRRRYGRGERRDMEISAEKKTPQMVIMERGDWDFQKTLVYCVSLQSRE